MSKNFKDKETKVNGNINVKFLILNSGKLLLSQANILKNWCLIRSSIHSGEDLYGFTSTEILKKTGWKTKNIRLFQINMDHEIEVIFIVDAVKNILDPEKRIRGLKWFQLNDLPEIKDVEINDIEIIKSFVKLIHPGKTLDLEQLPPVFKLKKTKVSNLFKLIE